MAAKHQTQKQKKRSNKSTIGLSIAVTFYQHVTSNCQTQWAQNQRTFGTTHCWTK